MTSDDLGTQVDRRQRHASLDSSLEFQQFQVHVHRLGKFRLPLADGSQLDRLP
jgi:hypothetical protein